MEVKKFAKDVAGAYVEFVNEIYAAGCRNLQFDDCVWGGMVNPKLAVALTGRKGDALEAYKKLLLQLNNEVAAQAPADLVINTHVCRGNYHSTFFSSGAYDGVADLLFGEENVNAYYLEYDDERSGGCSFSKSFRRQKSSSGPCNHQIPGIRKERRRDRKDP